MTFSERVFFQNYIYCRSSSASDTDKLVGCEVVGDGVEVLNQCRIEGIILFYLNT